MKDMLNRDIVVGDTLAMAAGDHLEIFKVIDSAPFALQLRRPGQDHGIVFPDVSKLVICDWAK
jgi:hypothetical protein